MRDCCHGISSADLLYNRFSDDASCCPATCSVSREPCRYAQIHGSFTSAQHFKNKHIPIKQSKTSRTGSKREDRLLTRHKLLAHSQLDEISRGWDASIVLEVCPFWPQSSCLHSSMCDSDEVPQLGCFGSSVKNEAIRCTGRACGHVKAFLSSCMFYTGLNKTIHLNQSQVYAALVPDNFFLLFTKMTSSSFHQ